jgi:pseudouridine kinase
MLAAWVAAWLGGADPVEAARLGHRAAAATVESAHTVRPDLADAITHDIEQHPSEKGS